MKGRIAIGVVLIAVMGLVGARVFRSGSASTPDVPAVPLESRSAANTSPSEPPAPQPSVVPPPGGDPVAPLVDRYAALAGKEPLSDADRAVLAELEKQMLARGEGAVLPLGSAIDKAGTPAGVRDRLFNLLRQIPGPAAEDRLVRTARDDRQDSLRTMAIDALAARRSDRALDTLAAIARTDPRLPAQPLIAAPRDPNDTSTSLPDEQVFTPRMQAMAALAGTKDPRAVDVLVEVTRNGPDEALRMEAARNLGTLPRDGRVIESLQNAAASDPSPYVRLAALAGLKGSTDRALVPVLERIAGHDHDAGVRLLARQVLESLGP